MAVPLRILFVEDIDDDATLIAASLRRAGYAPMIERVETAAAMAAALAAGPFDLVLSDFTLPSFNAPAALEVLHASGQDLPFIILSGTIQEEAAVAVLTAGAHDFIVKDRLSRLAPAIDRELRQAQARAERRHEQALHLEREAAFQAERARAQAALRATEARLKDTMDSMLEGAQIIGFDWQYLYANDALVAQGKVPREGLLGHTMMQVYPGLETTPVFAVLRRCMEGRQPDHMETEFTFPDGSSSWFDLIVQPVPEGIFILSHDITERKRAEDQVRDYAARLQVLAQASRAFAEAGLDYQMLLDRVARQVAEALGDTCTIGLLSDDGQYLNLAAVYSPDPPAAEFARAGAARPLRVEERQLTQQVLRTGQPLLVPVVSLEQLRLAIPEEDWPALEHFGSHSAILVAMRSQGQTIGALSLTRYQRERPAFTEQDVVLAQDLADRAALAITNARLFAERTQAETQLQQRLAELDAVNRVSAALRLSKTLDEMLPLLVAETLEVLRGSAGSVWLYDAARGEVRMAYQRGWGRTVAPFKHGEGIPGHVVATGEPYLSPDLKNDARMPESLRAFIPDGRGGACVPIRHGDETIGALFVNADRPHEFSAGDVRLLTTLAEITGSTIHRMQLHEQTRERLDQLNALREIDRAITSSMELRVTLGIVLEHVVVRLGVDAAAVLLLDRAGATLTYAAGRGFRTAAIQQTRLRIGEGYAGRAAYERRVVQAGDLQAANTQFLRHRLLSGEGFFSYVAAPLIAKGRILGVLEVLHRAPLTPDDRWLSFLDALAGQAAIAIDNTQLFESLQRSNFDLALAYDTTLEGWSRALDLRDRETEGHSQRVTELSQQLALGMGYAAEGLVHLRRGALLHDIGKMGIPDSILLKPGPLTADEWIIMRQHPAFAYDMLNPIAYLRPALDIPYCHHEKWDGTGYPRGLKADQIPLAARIFAVVDVWDALRSERPYRHAWPAEQVREHIRQQAGQHFDPAVVAAFLNMDLSNL